MAKTPQDAEQRRAVPPLICYPTDSLPRPNLSSYKAARRLSKKVSEILVAPRDASFFYVKAGQFFRITSVEGPQVGDLNLWNSTNPKESFYSGKTRALHGTHLSIGEQLWSSFPFLRPMATITEDTLSWYGIDEYGGAIHDIIGTRCDPYTNYLLNGLDYHYCCHSNLCRALSEATNQGIEQVEGLIHDVLNVFMCTGFTRDTGQYFMKGSPVRPGDFIEFFAEIDLLGALSACPGGDCSSEHSSDAVVCYPLLVEVFSQDKRTLSKGNLSKWFSPKVNGYNRDHGR